MDLLSGLKSYFKTNTTDIDNLVFKLHYRVTTAILIAFSILTTAKQYIGDPIDCIGDSSIPGELLDTWCWITSTFSVDEAWRKKVPKEVPYPGLDKYVEGMKRTFHSYYQWVCFVLFLQAIMFYTPRFLWRAMEGGRIKNLILGLNSPIVPEDTKASNRKLLVTYLVSHVRNHNQYLYSLVTAEVMNFANVVGQMFLTNTFLGGAFLKYGPRVEQFRDWAPPFGYDPMTEVFPRLAKCTFFDFGSSGSVQYKDAVCVLSVNIINEKIYLFLWFWFVPLALVSGLALVFRVTTILLPSVRLYVTAAHCRIVSRRNLHNVLEKFQAGDWLVLDLLAKNLDPLNFCDVVDDASRYFDNNKIDVS